MPISRALLLCLLAFVSLILPENALADEDEFSLGAGAGVGTSPYKGYSEQWTPLPIVSYEGEYAYIRGMSAGIKAVNLEFLEISAYAAYNNTSFRRHESSDQQLKLLNNRDASVVGGVGTRLLTPAGMFHLAVAADLMNNSNGLTGEAGYIYSFDFGTIEFLPAAGVYWNNAKYTNYYYGVSEKESQRSGLDRYKAKQSFSPYLGLTVNVTLNDNWEIFLQGEVTQLARQIKDSPMVNSSRTHTANTGIIFTF